MRKVYSIAGAILVSLSMNAFAVSDDRPIVQQAMDSVDLTISQMEKLKKEVFDNGLRTADLLLRSAIRYSTSIQKFDLPPNEIAFLLKQKDLDYDLERDRLEGEKRLVAEREKTGGNVSATGGGLDSAVVVLTSQAKVLAEKTEEYRSEAVRYSGFAKSFQEFPEIQNILRHISLTLSRLSAEYANVRLGVVETSLEMARLQMKATFKLPGQREQHAKIVERSKETMALKSRFDQQINKLRNSAFQARQKLGLDCDPVLKK